MCGIAGLVDWHHRADEHTLVKAVESLRFRGPDANAIVALGAAVLGHSRLAIIDLRPESNQPMSDPTGRYSIVFNGEIYNFKEVRKDLKAAGIDFRTNSDTEVLLQAFLTWGEAAVQRLNGMFAFAFWDRLEETLTLVRDRLGEKPLYFATTASGGFAFASDLNALRQIPGVPREINPGAVGQFLSIGYLFDDTSIISGVRKLQPGCLMTVSRSGVSEPECYWDLAQSFRSKRRFSDANEAAEELDALLVDAVRLRLVGDVPLGAFLSGGIDSSVIAAAIQRAGFPALTTFTIDFDQKEFSEADDAASIANFLGTNHVVEQVSFDKASLLLPEIVATTGEPFADTSLVPTYVLSALARQHATVCLSGDGADELFAGYETYRADKLRHFTSFVPKWMIRNFERLVDRFVPHSYGKVSWDYKLRNFLKGHKLSADEAHSSWRTILDGADRDAVIRRDCLAEAKAGDPITSALAYSADVADCPALDRAMYVDIKTWLASDILVKVDRASMANSLEVRPPFLDHRLVEFAASLSPNLRMRGLRTKWLLRRSQRRYLPAAVTKAKKRGFNAPVNQWLRGPLAELGRDLTLQGAILDWINPHRVETWWQEHLGGSHDHGFRLFALCTLGIWLSQHESFEAMPASGYRGSRIALGTESL